MKKVLYIAFKIIGGIFSLFVLYLIIKTVVIIAPNKTDESEEYKQGYRDAKLLYECDHDRTECELIKDTL